MKIISLKASNVKRLSAVEITPNGESVIIGGRNEQGKSSVLDAIAMALGGAKLVPPEPIRIGTDEAVIEVDLSDYLVTRKFKRVYQNECTPDGTLVHEHSEACRVLTGGVTSTLTVSSKPTGDQPAARFASPQALLDKIMGSLAFDPMAFVKAHGTDQLAILKRVVKLDTSDLDVTIKNLEGQRTQASRDNKTIVAAFGQLVPRHKDAPPARISTEEIAEEVEQANAKKNAANQATIARQNRERELDEARNVVGKVEREIISLELRLGDQRALLKAEQSRMRSIEANVTQLRAHETSVQAGVPDAAHLRRRMTEIEALNTKHDHNVKYDLVEAQVVETTQALDDILAQLNDARSEREARVRAATFPVDGLAFGENGVLYNGLPFEQASTAVKLRTSVAIGLALNPTVKVLLIHEGAFLDEDNLALVGKMAEDAGAQIWIERVGTQGVGVVIEDGKVQA